MTLLLVCPSCGRQHEHPNPPEGSPAASDIRELLAGVSHIISTLEHRIIPIMTATQDAETGLSASLDKLRTDLSTKLQAISVKLDTAANNTTDADTAAALNALKAEVDDMDTTVTGFDPDAPPAPASTDTGAQTDQPAA